MGGLSVTDGGMRIAQAGPSQAQPTQDPVDQDEVSAFREMLVGHDFRHFQDFGMNMLEYAARVDVNVATRDAMIATYLEVMSNPATPVYEQQNLRLGAEFLSLPYRADPASAPIVADSLARLVESGQIGADDLFPLVDPGAYANVTDGARALLTAINDGPVLRQLAEDVLDAARALPTGRGASQMREMGLIAAADIANMAAENGAGRAASTVVAAIAADLRAGTVDAATLIALNGSQINTVIAERSGLNALSALLNATPDTAANQADRDVLFSALVKARPYGDPLQSFRTSQSDDVPAALSELGQYFSRNASRLITADVENRTLVNGVPAAGASYDLLIADFARNVLLHPDNSNRAALTDRLGEVMADLSAAALDPAAPADVRNRATQDFAMLSGSLARAIERSVADAGRRSADQIAMARIVTDQISNAAIKYASSTSGPAGFLVSAAGKDQVSRFWEGVQQRATTAERDRTTEASLPLLLIAQSFRDAIGGIRGSDGGSQLPFQFDETFDTIRNR